MISNNPSKGRLNHRASELEVDKIWENINLNIERSIVSKFASIFFKTICQRNESKVAYTDTFIISQLLNVPFPIGERIFNVIKPKGEEVNYIYQSQFINLLEVVYCGSIKEKASLFFRIIDFDDDSIIHISDMQMFFMHLEYKNYQRREEEFQNVVRDFFEGEHTMTFDIYSDKITSNSDVVLLFFYLLFEKGVISENVLNYFRDNVVNNQIESNFFLKMKSINAFDYPSLDTKSAWRKKQKLRRMITRDSNCDSAEEKDRFCFLKDSRIGGGISNSPGFTKTQTTRKYSPTKRLYDLLGGKNGQITLSVSDESFYRTTKATHDLVDDNEAADYIDDLETLVSFENDIKTYFTEFNCGSIEKLMFPIQRMLPNIEPKPTKKSLSEYDESSASINNKYSFEMKKSLNLKALDSESAESKYRAIEFDLVLFQKGIKTKLLVIGNFLFVYYLKENQSTVTEKLRKIILLKNSFITIGSKGIAEEKTPFSFMLTIYFLEKKFIFCFFSESKRKKFIKLFDSINILNPTRDFFKDYTQKETLGQGHFGKIHIVENKKTHKTYVAKTINKTNSSLREIEWEVYISGFLCSFKHPNIVSFEDIYYTHDTVYIIMEYIPNGSLDKHLFLLPKNESTKLVLQIVSAINFLHSKSIMHRDIKLENIAINLQEKTVKLLDFGLSKVNFPTEKSYDCCGTVSYSAPEIFENKPYDLTVDIWSYGVILHVFQFNRYPIESKTFVKDIIKGELFFFFMKMEEKGKKYWDENVIRKLIFRTLVKEPCKRISGSEIEKILRKEIRE